MRIVNTIDVNDIIAFIEKAMENNLDIKTSTDDWKNTAFINIHNVDESSISIRWYGSTINIAKDYLDWVNIKVSEMDIARFKVECLKAQEYSKNKVIEYFNNFFKKNPTPTDINDLDNDEE